MSSFYLKIFALIFMIIDHIGFILFPNQIILRAIGRLAFPLFAYQMAVGFSHTRNKEKHILKLLLVGIIYQIPFSITLSLLQCAQGLNIIFTFVISLLIITTIEKLNYNFSTKKYIFKIKNVLSTLLLSVLLLALGFYLKVDYDFYGILLIVAFYFTLNKKSNSSILFFILLFVNLAIHPQSQIAILNFISLLDIIFIALFNGKKGYKFSFIFYVIFILHIIPMLIIKYNWLSLS